MAMAPWRYVQGLGAYLSKDEVTPILAHPEPATPAGQQNKNLRDWLRSL